MGLLQMRPTTASHNVANSALVNRKSARGLGLIDVTTADLVSGPSDLIWSKYRLFAAMASFVNLILHVFFRRAKKQMVRIATCWIVAFVENFSRVWIFPGRKKISKAVCFVRMIWTRAAAFGGAFYSSGFLAPHNLNSKRRCAWLTNTHGTISVLVLMGKPIPAFILGGLVDLGPKVLRLRFSKNRQGPRLVVGHKPIIALRTREAVT